MPRHNGGKCNVCSYVPAPIERGQPCPRCSARLAAAEGHAGLPPRSDRVGVEEMVAVAQARCDGVLRIVPKAGGETWFTWQFTSGRWAGHYLSVVQTARQGASDIFRSLEGKLDLVDTGRLKPSPDKYARLRAQAAPRLDED